jgi:hypothetical protein
LWLASRIKTKTHDCCQPWVLVKLLRSTSANGVAGYNDDDNDCLCDVFQHCKNTLQKRPAPVKFFCALIGGKNPLKLASRFSTRL